MITINVNVNGLDGLVSALQQLSGFVGQAPVNPVAAPAVAPVAVVPVPPVAPVAPVAPMPTAVPTVAPVAPVTVVPAPAPVLAVPVAAQTYSMDQLAVAATTLMDSGKQNELITLLGAFGVQALTQLPPEQYGNFATQLRALGAKI